MLKLLLVFLLAFNLNASYLGGKVKKGIFAKTTSSLIKNKATKQASKKVKDLLVGKIHKNSLDYKGDTHVYSISNRNGTYKVGESARGTDKFGNSIRAEQQINKLKKEKGDLDWKSKIRKEFDNKKDARVHEKNLIEKTRSIYGKDKNDKSILTGNKINR